MFKIIHSVKTICLTCGLEVRDEVDWVLHRRKHHLEHFEATPEGRRILDDLKQAGFKDEPDPWNKRPK